MNKKYIDKKLIFLFFLIILVIIFLISYGILNSWFDEEETDNDYNKIDNIIGLWSVNHSWYEDDIKIDEWSYIMTIFKNGTSKFEYENQSTIAWEQYVIINNQLCYENGQDNICYDIEFSDNKNKMILTGYIVNDYGSAVVIKDCTRL